MPRYLIRLSYDGTHFSGWQIQDHARTVQQCLEKALSYFDAPVPLTVTGAGRTDAGVHALRQYANFDLEKEISPQQMVAALNTRLPDDIRVLQSWQVTSDFSARYSALSRSYEYHLAIHRTPFNRLYSAFLPRYRINAEIIEKCLPYFLGEHDFSTFAKLNPDLHHQRCTVQEFTLEIKDDELIFRIRANRFLHNMVRRMIGTSIRLGHQNKDPMIIKDLIAAANPNNDLIFTAPPEGLFLAEVEYILECISSR
ncbi:MAG: tRNA pseudouridine(38-40) synthase TruA [Candidatus Cloacimonetes bacterium]|nr:tRNA pseudouridine(38-40) synthase TruA [Candidatus Cloacimonadota bacterium]